MSATRRVAAIDIGTVTTRLLVGDVSACGVTEVLRSTDITHLGEGLTRTGRLSEAAMDRVETVVAGYAARMRELGVEEWRAVATSASRDAANAVQFTERLSAYGVAPEVVSGDAEARLAFVGATHEVGGGGLLVSDIGGGSTELVYGRRVSGEGAPTAEVAIARSVDVGARRLTERFLMSDPPAPSELWRASAWVRREIGVFFDALPMRPRLSIALAGTATTLSAIHQGLIVYDPSRVHGSVVRIDEVREILERLISLPLVRRAAEVPGLDAGRAPVIIGGVLILLAVLERAGLESTVVSEHDILYGIVLEMCGPVEGGRCADSG